MNNGANYSADSEKKLCSVSPEVLPGLLGKLNNVPDKFAAYSKWQHGSGENLRRTRSLLGSVVLILIIPYGSSVEIRHFVLDGSSQLVIGKNVASHGRTNLINASE